ncbi:GtrA family protein [Duganella qianjiadongensis]|uniref:GtrA family protein n=1 Tax=Duganella qianjiadongensis TaxID=2692176 RepID=A0ABW9VPZ3_9BURK|nr:GtrA family protein [Duganella qianjiadongensis]MYM41025.1 GtrA family protein [Duganella qianjiadongensis]
MRSSLQQLLRFALNGVLGCAVDVAVLYLAMLAGANFYAGRGLSFLSAVWVTWQLNRRYTFAASGSSAWQEWWRYLTAMLGGGAVNYGVSSLLNYALPYHFWLPALAVAVGSLAGMSVNFIAARLFIFTKNHQE